MKISLNQTNFFDRTDFNGNVYVKAEDGKGFSALLVNCITSHYKTKLKNATRTYLVIEGAGTFTINDKTETANPGDMFIISDGDIYEYYGQMKLFEFNVPGTNSSNEEKL
ncbi:MAG TPA: AraC family ligand binding domain-containing protein [Candidatus Paceibacterota bacterium]